MVFSKPLDVSVATTTSVFILYIVRSASYFSQCISEKEITVMAKKA